MDRRKTNRPEFSRLVDVQALAGDGICQEIAADEAERAALARRFGLLSVHELRAEVQVSPLADAQLFRLSGRLSATLVQACVITLKPVASNIEAKFSLLFGEAEDQTEAKLEVLVEVDQDDPPEPIPPEGLDIGEAVVQELSLHLDPYPRHSDSLSDGQTGGLVREFGQTSGPFAILASLKTEK